ncbi:hypothetical protein V2J09_011789 [Rumex salicifolius]
MDISASEWSSGCESGWTVYLDESYISPNKYQTSVLDDVHHHHHQTVYRSNAKAEYEEDLSMVSDASSGPPHFSYGVQEEEEEVDCYRGARLYNHSSSLEKSKKKKAKEPKAKNLYSFLDDTASSPAFTYPNANMCKDPSMNQQSMDHHHLFGYSQENGYLGNSGYGGQYGVWQSTNPKQQDYTESSRSRGRRRG